MKYVLKRCPIVKRGMLFMEVIFDLWNDEFQTGYEIKVTLCNMSKWEIPLLAYLKLLYEREYDISRWDKIIRNIKQQKMSEWVIYE